MPRSKVNQPKRLSEKLKQMRVSTGLSQKQLFEKLEVKLKGCAKLHFGYLTRFEHGSNVPSILVLLAYAKVFDVSIECLADDEVDLPEKYLT